MSTEENKALMRRWFENFGVNMTREAMAEPFAPEFIQHSLDGDRNLEDFVSEHMTLLESFPDFSFTVEDLFSEGDKLALRWTWVGTHQGPYRGVPATGKRVRGSGITIGRVAGDRFVEAWTFHDRLGMMQQLGVAPPMGQG